MDEMNTTTTVDTIEGGQVPADNIDEVNVNNETKEEVSVKTFTQEEMDKIIQKRLVKERAKFEKEIGQAKFNEGLSEAEKLAKMTAQEKQEYEYSKRLAELEAREKDYTLRELKAESKSIFTDLGYSKDDIEALEGFINYENAEKTKESIEALDKVIKTLVDNKVQSEVNKRLITKTKPTTIQTTGGFTWQDVIDGNCSYEAWKKNGRKK